MNVKDEIKNRGIIAIAMGDTVDAEFYAKTFKLILDLEDTVKRLESKIEAECP